MNRKPVAIRRHAILKRHYRRVVRRTPQFHQLDSMSQWAALRKHVEEDVTPKGISLLTIMDSRAERRDEVLSALEEARAQSLR
jgi:hypothetical protein